MKSKTISIGLIGMIVIIIVGYFTFINLNFQNEIKEDLNSIEEYAKNEEWDKVLELMLKVDEEWKRKKYIITLNYAEAEFAYFEDHIHEIIGGAEGKQLDTTLSNILAAKELWKNLTQFVPEP